MRDVKFTDNQLITQHMIQMWFKFFGNNSYVALQKRTWILFSEIFGNYSVKYQGY